VTYVKFGAIGLLALVLFFGGWYCGSLKSKAQLDRSLAAQQATVAAALLAQRKISDAEEDRLNAVIAKYEATPIDPIALTVGTRLYKYAAASCSAVPTSTAAPTGVSSTPAVPSGPGPVELASDAAFKACAQDSAELAAIQAAWPK
jgi:hypothetical protein